jgi:hypothetical protein
METASQSWTQTDQAENSAVKEIREGHKKVKRMAETAASKTPSLLFLYASLASIAVSAFLQLRGRRQWSLFIGQWAPSFLIYGLYTKMVKSQGAD